MKKLRQFFRTHKRSRRQAAVQNLFAACLLLVLFFLLARGYAADHTPEKAVDEWCRDNMFGSGAICAVRTYETDGVQKKDAILCRNAKNGCRYEVTVFLQRENLLKWEACGSAWSSEPKPEKLPAGENGIVKGADFAEVSAGVISSMFTEFEPACGAEALKRDSVLKVSVYFNEMPVSMADAEVYFEVDLDTGEVLREESKTTVIDGVTYEYRLSPERMVFIAEKINEVIS